MTDDEVRSEFLRLMEVPGYRGVYVLGCFARYVTIYAQQVRALNLIDCLAKAGRLSVRNRVAVVGGGIAGLTAASAAIVRGVADVVLFEKEAGLLTVQTRSQQRHIHPHIYDWPAEDAMEDDAKLPLLNWQAKRAQDVAHDLLDQFAHLPNRENVEVRVSQHVTIRNGASGPEIESAVGSERFDVVILSSGFGRDSSVDTDSYWTDSRIDGAEAEHERGEWLVSGAGDGALTDLMRLCIADFSHKRVLEAVDQHARRVVAEERLSDAAANLAPAELAARFEAAASKIAPHLQGKLIRRQIPKVWLNSTREELFSARASILNRLIAAWLKVDGRFEFLPQPGRIGAAVGSADPVKQDAVIPSAVQHRILRHGPQRGSSFAEVFPYLYENLRGIEAEWHAATQAVDWTRERLFHDSDFETTAASTFPLRVDFGGQTGCIVIGCSREPPGAPLANKVQVALQGRFAKYARRNRLEMQYEPVYFSAIDSFRDSAAYERAVRAMCHSPIAIFDLTGYEPAVMLLLGIRATVRRGITLTVSQEARPDLRLPFNIGSLNPIRTGSPFFDEMYQALTAGFDALKAQPNVYLDLPAYDALRKLGEDHRTLEPEKQILILRWFDARYSDLVKGEVEESLKARFDTETVVTTLDSRSPQLTEQRLYAAIRRTRLCVADWTGWRPNVFFETGVRLAINSTDPFIIRCSERPAGWTDDGNTEVWPAAPPPGADEVEQFFRPLLFTVKTVKTLQDSIHGFDKGQPPRRAGALLSPGRTYAIVEDAIDLRQEAGAVAVQSFLVAEARSMVGDFVPGEGNSIPLVFPNSLGAQARTAAMEYLLASWFYLNHRHNLLARRNKGNMNDADNVLLEQLEEVADQIATLSKKFPDESFRLVCEHIATEMDGGFE